MGDGDDDGHPKEIPKDDPVKERCWDQREALPGEPRCVICGRYGEYICDETDDDVCSMECKVLVLNRPAKLQQSLTHITCATKIPTQDECFYVRDGNSDRIEVLRKNIGLCVKGESVPPPVMSFSSCNLPRRLLQNIESAGYEIPTAVQMQVIPAALIRRNLLVSADTGSGKTASYLVPIIANCSSAQSRLESSRNSPLAMVLAPTRELCVQIEDQAKMLAKGLPFKTALIVGGDAMPGQVYRMNHGVELIVATPGRLVDLLAKHNFKLDEISTLVLDEVDCMLQKDFCDQVMQIYVALSNPQLLMFSATISQPIEKMASSLSKDLVFVTVGKKPGTPNELVKQVVIWVDSKHKKRKLLEILTSKHFKPPTVVFVESRMGADLLVEVITISTGLKALSFHGEKGMKERRESMRLFLTGEVSVIVATSILGRGVDLMGVRQVIIFDMPKSMVEYVHQVGRASRMGEDGTAIIFVNEEDKRLFKELVESLRSSGAVIPRELANSYYSTNSHPVHSKLKKRKYHAY